MFAIVAVFGLALGGRYLIGTGNLAAVISSVIVDLVNGDRGTNDLGGLTWSPVLAKAAQAKADDMAAKGYFAHVSPEGVNSWYWFRQAGYNFVYAGENLAVDFYDSADVERAWMASPTHRANILNGHYTEIGVATAQGVYQGHLTTFAVQMFGQPAKATALPSPVQTEFVPQTPTEVATASTEPSVPVAGATAETGAVAAVGPVPGAVAVPLVVETKVPDLAPWWQHIVASPKLMLEYAYYALGLVILFILAVMTRFEFKSHHRHHLYAVAMLFVLMGGIFAFADLVLFATPTIAAGL